MEICLDFRYKGDDFPRDRDRRAMLLGGQAVLSLLEGNKMYNNDTRLLNALGFCYHKAGKKKEAFDVLASSLRLNPEQPDVKGLVTKVEQELKLSMMAGNG